LRDAGFASVESVADASLDDLMAVPHIGWATADALQRQARLLLEATGEGRPRGSDPEGGAGSETRLQAAPGEVPLTEGKKEKKSRGKRKEKEGKKGKKKRKGKKDKKKKREKKGKTRDKSRARASSGVKKKGKRKKGRAGKDMRKKGMKK
jgi:hypothetical protein